MRTIRTMLAAAIVAASALPASALTVDELMGVRNVRDPRISPDGRRVVFAIEALDSTRRGWDSDLWIVDAAGGEPRRLTTGAAWDGTPRWFPDRPPRVAFLRGDESGNQVFLMPVDGKEAPRALTKAGRGVNAFEWSPRGDRIAYLTSGGEGEAARARREAGADVHIEDEPRPAARIHVVDVATGEDRELAMPADANPTTLEWSPDGTRLAVTLQSGPATIGFFFGTDIALVDVATGAVTPRVARDGLDFDPVWSPDGASLAFLSQDGVKDWIGACFVCVVSADGSAAPKNISPMFPERDYDSEYHWSGDSKRVYLVVPRGATRQLYALDPATATAASVTEGLAVFGGFSFSGDGQRVAFLKTTSREPVEIFVSAIEPFEPRRVTDLNPRVKQASLGREELVRWKSFDGREIEGVLVVPETRKPNTPLPLVTVIHGGPSTPSMAAFSPQAGIYGYAQGELMPHVFTERGWAVFYPNFRGTQGYGRDFLVANVGDWGGGDFKDVMTGIDHLIGRGIADPKKLAIAGWSYGGTLTAYAITQTPRFTAALVGAGVTDHMSAYGTMDIPPFLERYMGGPPWEAPEVYRRCSAVTHARRVITPALLCYGEHDARVPASQGREFYRVLKGNDVPVELVVYPRSGHFVFEPALQRDLQERWLAWVDRWFAAVDGKAPDEMLYDGRGGKKR